jgi:hypothetical protein
MTWLRMEQTTTLLGRVAPLTPSLAIVPFMLCAFGCALAGSAARVAELEPAHEASNVSAPAESSEPLSVEEPPPAPALRPVPTTGCSWAIDDAEVEVVAAGEGEPALTLGVRVSRAVLWPGAEPHRLVARVEGSLAFEASASVGALRLASQRDIEGFGSLPAGVRVSELAQGDERSLAATVALNWRRPDSSSPYTMRMNADIYRTLVALPGLSCADLIENRLAPRPTRAGTQSGELAFGPRELVLHAEPDADGASLVLRSDRAVVVFVQQRRRTWRRIDVASDEGGSLSGWVDASELGRLPPLDLPGGGGVIGALGGRRATDGVAGVARVRRGARVFAAPGRGGWATVHNGDGFLVRIADAQPWALIEAAPDAVVVWWSVDDELGANRAWVRREDVLAFEPCSAESPVEGCPR